MCNSVKIDRFSLEQCLNNRQTKFWSFITSKTKQHAIPNEIVFKETQMNDEREITNAFANNFF